MTASVSFSCSKQAITLKTPAKGLSDGSDPIRQHGVQGQVLAVAANCSRCLPQIAPHVPNAAPLPYARGPSFVIAGRASSVWVAFVPDFLPSLAAPLSGQDGPHLRLAV